MTFSARTERRGQTINQLAAEKRLHKILDKPMAPDADGAMRTVQTIPLSRANRPSDGAPVNAPAAASSGHHK